MLVNNKKSTMKNNRLIFGLSPLGLLTLTACGGGESGGSSSGGFTSISGNAVKGPLENAKAFIDYNLDGILNGAETFVRTDQDGGYTLTPTQAVYQIAVITDDSTMDTSSNTVLSGVTLTAPSGAKVITPTTTLMQEGGLTAAEVVAVIGLPEGVDPLTFNPYGDGVNAAYALVVEKASQQIMSVVTAFAGAAEGAGASAGDAFAAALKSVADVVKTKADAAAADPSASDANTKIDFRNTADLKLIKDKVATEAATKTGIDKDAFDAIADNTATAVQNMNVKIAAVNDLNSAASKNIFSTTQVLANQVQKAAVAEVAKEGSGASGITFTDASVVETAALNSAPSDITLSKNSISEAATSLAIGTLSTTDKGQSDGFTYALASGVGDNADFEIDASTGVLSLKGHPDYETKASYSVSVSSTDEGFKTFSKTFQINVENVNETPAVANAIADKTITEDSGLTFQFASNTFADVDSGDRLTYSATLSDGDNLPSWLAFDGNTSTFSATPTNNNFGTVAVQVTATDRDSASVSDTFNLTSGNPAALTASKTVNDDTTSVSIYLNPDAPLVADGLGSLRIELGYDADVVSFDTGDLIFAEGFTGQAGTHDTSTGQLLIGGIALGSVDQLYTAFEVPILKFDLVAVAGSSAVSLDFSNILIDDVAFDDQILAPILDVI